MTPTPMTHIFSVTKVGLLLMLVCASLIVITTPRPVSASHTPTHIVSEPETPNVSSSTTQEKPRGVSKVFKNIGSGFKVVGRTIAGWFRSLGIILGLSSPGRPEGSSCSKISDCENGLACLNACDDETGCDVFDKLCTTSSKEGATTVSVKLEYAECGVADLCEESTICTRTCPEGVECAVTNRCLPVSEAIGSCEEASDCSSVCGELKYPAIGPSGYRAECRANSCYCQTEEVLPTLRITSCAGTALEENLSCPEGLASACTREGCESGSCDVRRTCLTAPAYGGQCLTNISCSDVNCAEGTAPFCDQTDNKCRCKSTAAVTVSCEAVSDCQGVSCPADQTRSCVSGVCSCEKKTVIEEDFVCTAASQCPSNCPDTFSPACVEGSCACQRVRENVPIACAALSDCDGVSCPAEFEKLCLDGSCACTKTTTE